MSDRHLQVLLIYAAFLALSIGLTLARRWLRAADRGPGVWRKYPTYIVLNLIFVAAAWLPPSWRGLALLLALIGGGASWEIARALRLSIHERIVLTAATVSLVLAAEWLTLSAYLSIWLGMLLLALAAGALIDARGRTGPRVMGIAGAMVYLPICLAPLLWLWHGEDGGFRVVFLYLIIAGNDAFAQITGQLLGGRLLAPQISPGKTVAGAIGGFVCAVMLGGVLSTTIGWSVVTGVCVGAALGIAGQIGDLVESSWKRALGIKDFSTLLGAQGGVLDRFDALLFASPVFYLIVISPLVEP
ncbi:MAG: phosphatidate cytidylyltransferase [Oscillochloridaceae bacterium]|nr:phosphatidate cytidylyltransferase [Chloroflexaceae bacterium]MDW8388994.1 phosphatidate cytidylyltransferase [Oscillochloridaceae bacterium]